MGRPVYLRKVFRKIKIEIRLMMKTNDGEFDINCVINCKIYDLVHIVFSRMLQIRILS